MSVGDHDGAGVSLATSMGSASVTATYVWDASGNANGRGDTSASDTVTGVKVSMPMGALTTTISHVTYTDGSSSDDTISAIAASYAVGGGTLSLAYESSTGSTKATETSGAYSMSLDADTTLAVGYTQADEGTTTNTVTEAKVTRALGGGASVYAEMKSSSGSGASGGQASTVAVGTSVSF
jgi:outer membrane usher protein FimD/PapC